MATTMDLGATVWVRQGQTDHLARLITNREPIDEIDIETGSHQTLIWVRWESTRQAQAVPEESLRDESQVLGRRRARVAATRTIKNMLKTESAPETMTGAVTRLQKANDEPPPKDRTSNQSKASQGRAKAEKPTKSTKTTKKEKRAPKATVKSEPAPAEERKRSRDRLGEELVWVRQGRELHSARIRIDRDIVEEFDIVTGAIEPRVWVRLESTGVTEAVFQSDLRQDGEVTGNARRRRTPMEAVEDEADRLHEQITGSKRRKSSKGSPVTTISSPPKRAKKKSSSRLPSKSNKPKTIDDVPTIRSTFEMVRPDGVRVGDVCKVDGVWCEVLAETFDSVRRPSDELRVKVVETGKIRHCQRGACWFSPKRDERRGFISDAFDDVDQELDSDEEFFDAPQPEPEAAASCNSSRLTIDLTSSDYVDV